LAKDSFGPEPKTKDMLPRDYAREALKRGLKYEQTLGANPFRFGMTGSTDTHTSLATVSRTTRCSGYALGFIFHDAR
jgi:hypothetical protein